MRSTQKVLSFTCEQNPQDTRGSCGLVQQIIDLTSKGPREYTLSALGIDQKWLEKNAEEALLNDVAPHEQAYSGQQAALFRRSFENLELVERAMRRYRDSIWTDDYPAVRVEIRIGSRPWTIESTSQKQFMVPLAVTADGRRFDSYDALIGQCIGEMLPERFPNKGRLLGSDLRYVVAEQVLREIRDQWDQLGSEAKLGEAYRRVQARYRILKSAIVIIGTFDVGDIANRDSVGTTWDAKLKDPSLPGNIRIGMNLPYEDGQPAGPDRFLESIGRFETQMKDAWIYQYASEHPEVSLELRFVTDRSLSGQAELRLREQYQAHGFGALLERLSPQLAGACSVEVDADPGGRHIAPL